MSNSKRWVIKRGMDQVVRNLDQAIKYLALYGHEYETPHPEIYNTFCNLVQVINNVKTAVQRLKDSI